MSSFIGAVVLPWPTSMPCLFYGWVVAIAGFMMTMSFGFFSSYGVFFLPIVNEFHPSSTAASFAYSLALISCMVSNLTTGWLMNRLGTRVLGLVGTVLLTLGFFLSSYAHSMTELYLSYGIVAGAGWGFFGVVAPVTAMRWFEKKRGTAISIVASGSGVASLLLPPIFQVFVTGYGWRETFAISGVMACLIMLTASLITRSNPGSMKLEPYGHGGYDEPLSADPSTGGLGAIKTTIFKKLYVSFFLGSLGLQAFIVHVVPYSIQSGLTGPLAANTLAAVGVGSLVGRLIMGPLSDKMGRIYSLSAMYFLLPCGIFSLLYGGGVAMAYFGSVLVGLSYGGFTTMIMVASGDIFGVQSIGGIIGVMGTAFGIGGMIGPILAGSVYDILGNYQPAFLIAMALGLVATWLTLTLRKVA